MGSTAARSAVTKYSAEPRTGTGRYTSRAALMATSVASASATRLAITAAGASEA